MKTKTFILAAMLVLFAACDSREEVAPAGEEGITLFSQTDASLTRATLNNTWDGGEQVKVSFGGTVYDFTAATDGRLSADGLYWNDYTSIDVRAWYPDIAGYTFATDQRTTANMQAADFIFAGTVSGITRNNYTDAAKKLVFTHSTAKVTVTLAKGKGITDTDLAGAAVLLRGYTSGTPDNSTGIIAGNGAGWIMPLSDNNTHTALLIPQNMEDKPFIKITIAGSDYYYTPASGDADLQPGYGYNYTVTVSKTEIAVTGTITSWDSTTPGSAIASLRGIRTAADLVQFSADWNAATTDDARANVVKNWSHDGTPTGTVRLLADIDMSSVANFTPIGNTSSNRFSATFDGCGYTISNLTVSGAGNAGLFGRVFGGSISRVSVENSDISGNTYAGGIAGMVEFFSSVTGCTVTGGTVTADNYAGGIAGYVFSSSSVTGCSVTGGTVTGNFAGGIAGYVSSSSSSSVTGCVAAPASVSGSWSQGVVAGYLLSGSSITAVCYVNNAGGVTVAVGNNDGTTTNLMPFASTFGDFFTTQDGSGFTPIQTMNDAISSSGWQWVAQASGVLPKIVKQ